MERSIGAPGGVRYNIFEVMSDNRRRRRDISHSRKVLGYVPTGSADIYDIRDKGGRRQVNMTKARQDTEVVVMERGNPYKSCDKGKRPHRTSPDLSRGMNICYCW